MSIRHGSKSDYPSNTIVLRGLLEILFLMRSALRKPRRLWKPIHDLSVILEKGIPRIKNLIENDTLNGWVKESLQPTVKELTECATSELTKSIMEEYDEVASLEIEKH